MATRDLGLAGEPPAGRMRVRSIHARRAILRRWRVPPAVAICVLVLGMIGIGALAAPWLSTHDPTTPSLRQRNLPPAWFAAGSSDHLLGTDNLGYDLWSRLLYGARASLVIGFAAAVLGTVIGTTLGLVAGYMGGWLNGLIMLVADAQLSTPFLLVAIAAVTAFGPGLATLIAVAGASGWVTLGRACRAAAMALRQREFVLAARAVGATDGRILARHLLPNMWSLVLVIATIELRGYILLEASLSFLGLGVQPPNPSWGGMVDQGRDYLATEWWIGIIPSIALATLVVAVSFVGDWFRDVLDPTLRAGP